MIFVIFVSEYSFIRAQSYRVSLKDARKTTKKITLIRLDNPDYIVRILFG